jgi:y4mF family transcriptional regulator
VRLSDANDIGNYARDRRRDLRLTQAALASQAGVSRRWLADLEAGKPTIEVGLVLRVLRALGLELMAAPVDPRPNGISLDEIIEQTTRRGGSRG